MKRVTSTYCIVLHFTQAAVEALNALQSNAAVLEKSRLNNDRHAINNLPLTEKYIGRLGMSVEEIDKNLPIIHVSGTKVNLIHIFNVLLLVHYFAGEGLNVCIL